MSGACFAFQKKGYGYKGDRCHYPQQLPCGWSGAEMHYSSWTSDCSPKGGRKGCFGYDDPWGFPPGGGGRYPPKGDGCHWMSPHAMGWPGMKNMMMDWFHSGEHLGHHQAGYCAAAAAATQSHHYCDAASQHSPQQVDLIEQVKHIQRDRNINGYDLWQSFCERHGGGKKDPATRSLADLEAFVAEVASGSAGSGGGASMDSKQHLVMKVKQGQRSSDAFKEAWWQHCKDAGQDVNDPTKHAEDFLQEFMNKAPEVVLPDNTEHLQLVQAIKSGQRTEEYKLAWYDFCTRSGTQTFDPGRHPSSFLQSFLAQAPVSEAPMARARKNRYNPY